jgi:hypothetical protein
MPPTMACEGFFSRNAVLYLKVVSHSTLKSSLPVSTCKADAPVLARQSQAAAASAVQRGTMILVTMGSPDLVE